MMHRPIFWLGLLVASLAWLAQTRPANADLIGSAPEMDEADAASPVTAASPAPAATPVPSANPSAATDGVREQLKSLGLSPSEIDARIAQLQPSELEALSRDTHQVQVAGVFSMFGIEAGSAVIIFLVVAVIVGLWWWFGE